MQVDSFRKFHYAAVFILAFDDSSDITGILAQMIDDPSTCPLPYYRAPNTDD